MTRLIVCDAVCAASPHLRIDATVAGGFSGHPPTPDRAKPQAAVQPAPGDGKG